MRLGLLLLLALPGSALTQSVDTPPAAAPLQTFHAAEAAFKAFKALKISGSQRAQARAIKTLVGQTQRLTGMYREVVQNATGDERWAALYRLCSLHDLFAQKLDASPLPTKLTPDQAEVYRSLLADKVAPFRAKAAKSFEMMIAKSKALGVSNRWTQAAAADLKRLSTQPGGAEPGK